MYSRLATAQPIELKMVFTGAIIAFAHLKCALKSSRLRLLGGIKH
jgi:hypothetical protein